MPNVRRSVVGYGTKYTDMQQEDEDGCGHRSFVSRALAAPLGVSLAATAATAAAHVDECTVDGVAAARAVAYTTLGLRHTATTTRSASKRLTAAGDVRCERDW